MFRENLCLSCSNSLDVLIGAKLKKERAQLLVNAKKIIKKPEYDLEEDDQEVLKDQNYVEVLGQDIQGIWRGDRGGMYTHIFASSQNCFAGCIK